MLSKSLGLILLVSVAQCLHGDPGDDQAMRIAAYILQLGDDDFEKRQKASRGLEAIGEQALPALKNAALAHKDIEIRRRSQQLVRAIMVGCRQSKSLGLELVLIDPGTFDMGSPRQEWNRRADENPHQVRITKPFLLGAYEVTQDQFQKVMKSNPSWFTPTGGGKDKVAGLDTSRFPVEKATWFDAIEFCNRLSKQDGYEPYYKVADVKREGDTIKAATVTIAGGNGYRLPTEAEWEFACRVGTSSPFHFGSENTGKEANVKPGPAIGYGAGPNWQPLGRMAKVGSYNPNSAGLYDMHGNAGEWCWDWYDKDYYGKSPADEPHGPDTGNHRVLRGGSWLVNEGSCRSASRFWLTPDESNYVAGFRVGRTP